MQENIETRVPPEIVWQAWERFQEGQKGKQGSYKYKILDVEPGKGFSILWKSLFVRMLFIHRVEPLFEGSRISYQIQIKGLFSPIVRFFMGAKIRKSVSFLLKSFVKQLEQNR